MSRRTMQMMLEFSSGKNRQRKTSLWTAADMGFCIPGSSKADDIPLCKFIKDGSFEASHKDCTLLILKLFIFENYRYQRNVSFSFALS